MVLLVSISHYATLRNVCQFFFGGRLDNTILSMYTIGMGMKKIKRLIQDELNGQYELGYSEGYSDGRDYSDGSDDSFQQGVIAERERMQSVLKMMADNDLKLGRGTKAKMYLDLAEFLAFTYDPNDVVEDEDF